LQPCVGTVLGTVCEIESGTEWYFRSCTQCASLVTINDGKLTCKKCTECKGAVLRLTRRLPVMFFVLNYFFKHQLIFFARSYLLHRFKLHVVVMDETGSTTFVFFDKIVTQFIGRTVQDLLDVCLIPDNTVYLHC